jgi:hypothetical protein
MKLRYRSIVQLLALTAVLIVGTTSAFADDYTFSVHNNTNKTIKKILVSEDGEEFGFFDIGKGIKAGATVELVWDASTNGESCSQYFKAVFDGGDESEPVEFDFCEEGLTLEFE